MPLPMLLVLMLVGLLLLHTANRRATLAILWLVMLGFLAMSSPISNQLLTILEDQYPPLDESTDLNDISAVVVLGGGWSPDRGWPISSQLSESSAIRLFEGVRLLKVLPNAQLVVSGGNASSDHNEPLASALSRGAQQLGIPAERIIVASTPLDTAQEARALKKLLPLGKRFILVTSAAHMPRAMAHFRKVGLEPTPAPTQRRATRHVQVLNWKGWVPSVANLSKAGIVWHEFLGLLAIGLDH